MQETRAARTGETERASYPGWLKMVGEKERGIFTASGFSQGL